MSNILVSIGSLLLCFLLTLARLPGMEILLVAPNWLVIWLVTWSLSHTRAQSLVAAVSISLVLDALSSSYPTHLLGMVIVAYFNSDSRRKNNLVSFNSIILVVLKVFLSSVVHRAIS